jgi:hypothetical protein
MHPLGAIRRGPCRRIMSLNEDLHPGHFQESIETCQTQICPFKLLLMRFEPGFRLPWGSALMHLLKANRKDSRNRVARLIQDTL